MKLACFLLLMVFTISCSKDKKDEQNLMCCGTPAVFAMIGQYKEEYKTCSCLTGIRQTRYKGEGLVEFYFYDPACFGINRVYDLDGNQKFVGNQSAYEDYREKMTDVRILWTCEDGDH